MMRIHFVALLAVVVLFSAVCSHSQSTGYRLISSGEMQAGRAAHAATRLDDGRVLITGGMRVNAEFHDSAELFDPRSRQFSMLKGRLTMARVSHTATLLQDGRVLIVGGWSQREAPEASAEIFDPKGLTFRPVGEMRVRRSGHTATLLEDGRVLIAGGHDGSLFHRSIEVFDPKRERFQVHSDLVSPRKLHTATRIGKGRILFAGGEISRNQVTDTVEILDVAGGQSTTVKASLSTNRYKHDAIQLRDGRVLIYGGSDARDRRGKLRSAELFDPKTLTFRRTADMNLARFKIGSTSALLHDGKVLVAGGASRAEVFDPDTLEFSLVGGGFDSAYHFSTVSPIDQKRVLIVGGYKFRNNQSPLATQGAWILTRG